MDFKEQDMHHYSKNIKEKRVILSVLNLRKKETFTGQITLIHSHLRCRKMSSILRKKGSCV